MEYVNRVLPNLAGLDYNGPFYDASVPRAVREERRALVIRFVPHTFAEYPPKDVRRGLCRICSFPMADAACADAFMCPTHPGMLRRRCAGYHGTAG